MPERVHDDPSRTGSRWGVRAAASACLGAALAASATATPAHAAGDNPRFLAVLDWSAANDVSWDVPVRLNGELFAHSLRAKYSSSYLEYDLGRQCSSLSLTFGIDERVRGATTAPVVFTTSADGSPVDTRTVAPGASQTVSLDVTGALRVRFEMLATDTSAGGAWGAAIGNPIALCTGNPVVAGSSIEHPCSGSSFTQFDDVDSDYAHAPGIRCLTGYGIASGTSPAAYAPERDVTRGQMAAFLARLVINTGGSLPPSPPDAFGDDNGTTFERDINQLAAVGIVQGGTDRRYNPQGAVTRGQMAAFLARTFAYRYGSPLGSGPTVFGDTEGTVFETDISRVAGAGIASGYGDGTYQPAARVTRGQMASFIARTLGQLYRAGGILPRS